MDYIESSAATLPGQTMRDQVGGWGEASSIPPTVDDLICGETLSTTPTESVVTNRGLADLSSPAGGEELQAFLAEAKKLSPPEPASDPGLSSGADSGGKSPARTKRMKRGRGSMGWMI